MSAQTRTADAAHDDVALDDAQQRALEAGGLEPDAAIATFRAALAGGEPWYPALLEVIGRWVAPEEQIDGETRRYLIAGEAFDWLRLAQRLVEAAAELVPEEEAEQLLLFGLAPESESAEGAASEDEFARAIGPEKYRAYLNFQYGVVVEEALLLSAEQELQKAGSLAGANGQLADVAAYARVYGRPFDELMVMYRAETGVSAGERLSVGDLQAFIYWCAKFRFRTCEPARVASDTRKALALLSTMEAGRERVGRLTAEGMKDVVAHVSRPAARRRRPRVRRA